MHLLDSVGRDRAIVAKGGLGDFIRLAWKQVEPSRNYVENWHIGAISEHLQAVSSGQIRNLVINVPPGSTKSLSVSVFWPVWNWIMAPELRWIYASFDLKLQKRDGRRCLDLISSKWFQDRWGEKVALVEKDAPVLQFSNTAGGWRYGTSVRGTVTGNHADRLIVDDPIKPLDATKVNLERCLEWWDGTMGTRQVNPKTTAKVVMMQRLHDRDLAGEMIRRGGYEVLRLPMRYEAKNPCVTVLGKADPRTEEGQLLDPVRVPEEEVQKLEAVLGPLGTAAQLQQRPTPAGGNIFQLVWLQNTYESLPLSVDQWVLSADCTFKGKADSDFVCIQVWARVGVDFYLVDLINERLSFTDTVIRIREMSNRWPLALVKLVEDAANGAAVVDTLRRELHGLELVKPKGGKEARANAVTPVFRSGNVYLPASAPWLGAYKDQLSSFPYAANDDMVDSTTQALSWMLENVNNLEAAMAEVRRLQGRG